MMNWIDEKKRVPRQKSDVKIKIVKTESGEILHETIGFCTKLKNVRNAVEWHIIINPEEPTPGNHAVSRHYIMYKRTYSESIGWKPLIELKEEFNITSNRFDLIDLED